jgi:biopolymer transport protein ExbD
VINPQRKQTAQPRRVADVDMTSMVDVTFLLLIFFMVTASFKLQKSIEMPRQQSDSAGPVVEPATEQISLQVDQYGSFLVMTPDWELETPGKQNLTSALKTASEQSNQPLQLSIEVHELARLKALVAALDAGATAGFSDIRVTQYDFL